MRHVDGPGIARVWFGAVSGRAPWRALSTVERNGVAQRPKLRGLPADESQTRASRPVALEDLELVERVKGGDAAAYSELVLKYQDRVYNAVWRICGHVENARDLTQDAFLKAFQRIQEFRQLSGFYTWVFRIAVNLTLSHQRSSNRRKTVSLDAEREAGGAQADSLARQVRSHAEASAERGATDAELQAHVARALQGLDDEHRAVVVLRDIEGLDYAEIADILDVPTGTVKSRLHRGRMALRQAIGPLLGGSMGSGA